MSPGAAPIEFPERMPLIAPITELAPQLVHICIKAFHIWDACSFLVEITDTNELVDG